MRAQDVLSNHGGLFVVENLFSSVGPVKKNLKCSGIIDPFKMYILTFMLNENRSLSFSNKVLLTSF